MLAALKGEDADESAEESSLVEDVRFAVEHTLEQLWETDTPVMAGGSLSGRRIPLKMRAIETAYTKQHTKAQAAITEPPVVPAAAERERANAPTFRARSRNFARPCT